MTNQEYKRKLIERSYKFSLDVITVLKTIRHTDLAGTIMTKQLLRSAMSVGANIVEAQAASSKKDFANFLQYALKSANETKYWLGLIRDSGTIKGKQINLLLQEAIELASLLGSSVTALKQNK